MNIELTINGEQNRQDVPPDTTLLSYLRDYAGLTGTKWGCKTGDCGACTVLIDGEPVVSCITTAKQVEGHSVRTIEGVDSPETGLSDLQAAFVANGAVQCGFCTPGMILTSEALLAENPNPNEEEIREALSGNLCRCTGYNKIVDAVLEVVVTRARSTA